MNKTQVVTGGIVIALASPIAYVALKKEEGTRYTPYYDVGGVLTVCEGVTKGVIKGRVYTKEECKAMTMGAMEEHGAAILKCTPTAQWTQHRYDAMLLLAYNVGWGAVCGSCLSKGNECIGDLIRANKWPEACQRITAYGKVRIDGALRDCSDRRWNCYGVYTRRKTESDWCNGIAPPIASLGVIG